MFHLLILAHLKLFIQNIFKFTNFQQIWCHSKSSQQVTSGMGVPGDLVLLTSAKKN